MIKFIQIALFFLLVLSKYPDNGVVKLDRYNYFDVINKGNVFVRYWSHSDYLSIATSPIWSNLARYYKIAGQNVTFAEIDCSREFETCKNGPVNSYPTLKWHGADPKNTSFFTGDKTQEAIGEFLSTMIGCDYRPPPSCFVELTSENLTKVAMDPLQNVLVVFSAEWCGYCRNIRAALIAAATAFTKEDHVLFAHLDGEKYGDGCGKFKPEGFPTIRFFPAHHSLEELHKMDASYAKKIERMRQRAEKTGVDEFDVNTNTDNNNNNNNKEEEEEEVKGKKKKSIINKSENARLNEKKKEKELNKNGNKKNIVSDDKENEDNNNNNNEEEEEDNGDEEGDEEEEEEEEEEIEEEEEPESEEEPYIASLEDDQLYEKEKEKLMTINYREGYEEDNIELEKDIIKDEGKEIMDDWSIEKEREMKKMEDDLNNLRRNKTETEEKMKKVEEKLEELKKIKEERKKEREEEERREREEEEDEEEEEEGKKENSEENDEEEEKEKEAKLKKERKKKKNKEREEKEKEEKEEESTLLSTLHALQSSLSSLDTSIDSLSQTLRSSRKHRLFTIKKRRQQRINHKKLIEKIKQLYSNEYSQIDFDSIDSSSSVTKKGKREILKYHISRTCHCFINYMNEQIGIVREQRVFPDESLGLEDRSHIKENKEKYISEEEREEEREREEEDEEKLEEMKKKEKERWKGTGIFKKENYVSKLPTLDQLHHDHIYYKDKGKVGIAHNGGANDPVLMKMFDVVERYSRLIKGEEVLLYPPQLERLKEEERKRKRKMDEEEFNEHDEKKGVLERDRKKEEKEEEKIKKEEKEKEEKENEKENEKEKEKEKEEEEEEEDLIEDSGIPLLRSDAAREIRLAANSLRGRWIGKIYVRYLNEIEKKMDELTKEEKMKIIRRKIEKNLTKEEEERYFGSEGGKEENEIEKEINEILSDDDEDDEEEEEEKKKKERGGEEDEEVEIVADEEEEREKEREKEELKAKRKAKKAARKRKEKEEEYLSLFKLSDDFIELPPLDLTWLKEERDRIVRMINDAEEKNNINTIQLSQLVVRKNVINLFIGEW